MISFLNKLFISRQIKVVRFNQVRVFILLQRNHINIQVLSTIYYGWFFTFKLYYGNWILYSNFAYVIFNVIFYLFFVHFCAYVKLLIWCLNRNFKIFCIFANFCTILSRYVHTNVFSNLISRMYFKVIGIKPKFIKIVI
jgi:hypothetical protein